MKKIYLTTVSYLILGLGLGLAYRELTKLYLYTGSTQLSVLHTHALTLGFLFHLIVLSLNASFKLSDHPQFNRWWISYQIALLGLLSTLFVRGFLSMTGQDFAGLSHVAGTFHTLLAISLGWFMWIVGKSIKAV